MSERELDQLVDEFSLLRQKDISEEVWAESYQALWVALGKTEDKFLLERSVTNKCSWDLPIPFKLALLEIAKYFGCNSYDFWKDYYRYKAMYMKPDDPERPFYLEMANGKYV